MYAQEFKEDKTALPAHYGGTAFAPREPQPKSAEPIERCAAEEGAREPTEPCASAAEETRNPWETPTVPLAAQQREDAQTGAEEGRGGRISPSLLLSLPRILSSSDLFTRALQMLSGMRAHLLRGGTEDLLILAIALILFFSKNGDKECAILVLLLLFVN